MLRSCPLLTDKFTIKFTATFKTFFYAHKLFPLHPDVSFLSVSASFGNDCTCLSNKSKLEIMLVCCVMLQNLYHNGSGYCWCYCYMC